MEAIGVTTSALLYKKEIVGLTLDAIRRGEGQVISELFIPSAGVCINELGYISVASRPRNYKSCVMRRGEFPERTPIVEVQIDSLIVQRIAEVAAMKLGSPRDLVVAQKLSAFWSPSGVLEGVGLGPYKKVGW